MTTLRTPLEVALETRLPLDFGDLDVGDYDHHDAQADARESALLRAALDTGDSLLAESALDAIAFGSRGGA